MSDLSSKACEESSEDSKTSEDSKSSDDSKSVNQCSNVKLDVVSAHKKSIYHRKLILASQLCGCFYCCKTFTPSAISQWVDKGTTALCPYCSIDSVIKMEEGMDVVFLEKMRDHWF